MLGCAPPRIVRVRHFATRLSVHLPVSQEAVALASALRVGQSFGISMELAMKSFPSLNMCRKSLVFGASVSGQFEESGAFAEHRIQSHTHSLRSVEQYGGDNVRMGLSKGNFRDLRNVNLVTIMPPVCDGDCRDWSDKRGRLGQPRHSGRDRLPPRQPHPPRRF